MEHVPVMLEETLALLDIKTYGTYVDATLGRGGHSLAILKKIPQGRLYAFDKDSEAIAKSEERLAAYKDQIRLIQGSYTQLETCLRQDGIAAVDGILFDLGVSSPQFDDPKRGFSYRFDTRLDMRMDQSQHLSAYEVVNEYSEEKLVHILREYGEERYAKGIARAIIANRPIETSFALVDCIKKAYPAHKLREGHPAKKSFQAIRIEVNQELEEIKEALMQATRMLKVGGRLVVISFHSLEDKIVKGIFNELAKPKKVDPRIPFIEEEKLAYRLVGKALKASETEVSANNRAHSAIVRCIERVI